MHMQRDPETMQEAPSYADLMGEVEAFLRSQTEALMAAGVAAERISLDPGFGFGKTPDHNLTMLNRLGSSIGSVCRCSSVYRANRRLALCWAANRRPSA